MNNSERGDCDDDIIEISSSSNNTDTIIKSNRSDKATFTKNNMNQNRRTRPERNWHTKNANNTNNNEYIDKIEERISQISGPTFDLPALELSERKFSGRNRLYIGNIGSEFSESDIASLFESYGETSDIFVNKEKNFAFVKLDFHSNAEKAKQDLDGKLVKSRNLKVRFAPNVSSIKVKNLSSCVTNELLHYGFSVFGDVDRTVVLVDERGKSTGEGIVEFAKKGSALNAIRRCSNYCYFLTSSVLPVIVESYDAVGDSDGLSDKHFSKKSADFRKEREIGPRIAPTNSFEHEFGVRWKTLFSLQKQKELALKKDFQMEREKLQAQLEYARFEHETEVLREQLRIRELDKDRQKREWELKQREAEEQKLLYDEMIRVQKEAILYQQLQDDVARNRQNESELVGHAQNLNSLMDHQENLFARRDGMGSRQSFSSYEDSSTNGKNRQQDNDRNNDGYGHWVRENTGRNFELDQAKRRRY